jgi:hypothetical protein
VQTSIITIKPHKKDKKKRRRRRKKEYTGKKRPTLSVYIHVLIDPEVIEEKITSERLLHHLTTN